MDIGYCIDVIRSVFFDWPFGTIRAIASFLSIVILIYIVVVTAKFQIGNFLAERKISKDEKSKEN